MTQAQPRTRRRRGRCAALAAAGLWGAVSMLACGAPPGQALDAAPSTSWSARAPIGEGGRLEAGVVALDGRVYLLGGFASAGRITADVDVYDPAADAWTPAAPMPAALHHMNAVAVGGKIYVLGALTGTDFAPVGDVYIYDPAADAWSKGASMPAGTERGASAVGALGTDVVVAGGSRDDAVATVSIYSTTDDSWRDGPPLPAPTYHAVGQVVAGVLYAVGGLSAGLTTGTSHALHQVEAYDPAAGSWSARADMPTARGGCAAGVLGGFIVCAGGEADRDNNGGIATQTEAYDPAADTWQPLEPMRDPRGGTGGAVTGGLLYVPGGARIVAFFPVDTNDAFDGETLAPGGSPPAATRGPASWPLPASPGGPPSRPPSGSAPPSMTPPSLGPASGRPTPPSAPPSAARRHTPSGS